MESLYKTRIKNIQPIKIKCSCLLCEKLFHIEDINLYNDNDNYFSICIDCSAINNKEHIIKYCNEKVLTINYNDTKNIKSVYLIRCECFKSHQIVVNGLRNLGVQDYNNIYCNCQKVNAKK